ncbi:hypothetical protein KP509_22G035100 [Ceratopteris richardii]|uniref:MLO-like protein n=1 Tax=Ceratopteris richardii TaxID=49495 RepID=A0A8T2S5Y6_CERRI|nr:hypothetical protein KP509_22G035100 [Ceratopteris richardii]
MAGGGDNNALLSAPTWAIALTCAVFVTLSLAIERIIHRIGKKLSKNEEYYGALLSAFNKMKDELFMVGISSISLSMGQKAFSNICIPAEVYKFKPVCQIHLEDNQKEIEESMACSKGKVHFMTTTGLHSLHILVFILAAFHILYTAMMVVLGTLEVRRWRAWEASAEEKSTAALRLVKETTFLRTRGGIPCSDKLIVSYVVSFFKQFYKWRICKSDYVTFRSGFIKYHCPSYPEFNFHKVIMRSFVADCKRVVGVGWKLWAYAIFWVLINVNGWQKSWIVYTVPLLVVLLVGAYMQQIITNMANKIRFKQSVVEGAPIVLPDSRNFGCGGPRVILKCFHWIVFENALTTTVPIWASITFDSYSCIYD